MKEGTVFCRYCGKEQSMNFGKTINERLAEKYLCFTCDFWVGKIDLFEGEQKDMRANIGGYAYVIENEKANLPSHCRGYSGEEFKILFNDGRKVTTTNLWLNGKIPNRFRERLFDNAIFETKKTNQGRKR